MPSQSPGDGASPVPEPPGPFPPVSHIPDPEDAEGSADSTQVLRPDAFPLAPAASGFPGLHAAPPPGPAGPPVPPVPPGPPGQAGRPGLYFPAPYPPAPANQGWPPPAPGPGPGFPPGHSGPPAGPPGHFGPPPDGFGPGGPPPGGFGPPGSFGPPHMTGAASGPAWPGVSPPPGQPSRGGPESPAEELTYRLAPPGPASAARGPVGPTPPGSLPGVGERRAGERGVGERGASGHDAGSSHGGQRDGEAPELPPLTGPHPLPPPPQESFTVRRTPLPPPGRIADGPSWPSPPPSYLDSPSGGGLLPAIPPRITSPGGPLGGEPPARVGQAGPGHAPGTSGAPGTPGGFAGPGAPDGSGSSPRRPQVLTLIAAAAAIVVVIAVVGIILGTRTDSGGDTTSAAPAPAGPTGPADPAGAGPAPGAPPSQLSPEDTLRGLLNTVTMTGCSASAQSDIIYADATLSCIGAGGIEVLAFHFPDRSALERQVGARATYYADAGNCDSGQESAEEWTSLQEPNGGARLCYKYADRFVTFWSISDSLVAFAASDPNPARLIAWWHGFDPIRR
ncbi:hypothetical protein CC117_25080 [Parafrankia colletiae]|uniref:Uncharacterized protein n=1 Tax=Parafrankia colletiae TaxID=573497 RepID=A0A1S1QFY2_9ACTN|nr:hypothetical protein [Parafrankia colletiae]MCK9902717.1 hypothetical protein [Frankia sp. Cpl3]OHV32351.1 hypothetical protein CC117_25080 [Parafrankia colletiae]